MPEILYDKEFIDEMKAKRDEMDLMIKIAEAEQISIDTLLDEVTRNPVSEEEENAFFARSQSKTLRVIQRTFRQEARKSVRHALPRMVQFAAAVVLLFFIGLSTAVATVAPVRYQLMNFLINIEREYTELSLVETGEEIDVPEGWRGHYYPAFIPEGYELNRILGDEDLTRVWYVKSDDEILSYTEYGPDSATNIDTEDAEISYITIHGKPVFMARKENYAVMTWSEHDRYFVCWITGEADALPQVVESIQRIR